MQSSVSANGQAIVTLTAGQKIAVFSTGVAVVSQLNGYPNFPDQKVALGTANAGVYTSSALAAGGTIIIDAGSSGAVYEVGLTPVIKTLAGRVQSDPATLNATGTLTAAMIMGDLVTSTTAAAVAATLDTGAIMDTSSAWAINDCVDWAIINTGGNTLTVTASTGHTIVGVAAVLTVTSARFRTRKTAASTFVTYRMA